MSTLLVFTRKYFDQSAIIEYCFPLERKCRIEILLEHRPWIAAFDRLMRQRPRLRKQELAEYGGWHPSKISMFTKGPKQPDDPNKPRKPWPMPDLQTFCELAEAFTACDRDPKRGGNPKAPPVEIWEFFVTDEQSAALHMRQEFMAEQAAVDVDPEYLKYKRLKELERMLDAGEFNVGKKAHNK